MLRNRFYSLKRVMLSLSPTTANSTELPPNPSIILFLPYHKCPQFYFLFILLFERRVKLPPEKASIFVTLASFFCSRREKGMREQPGMRLNEV